MDKIAVLIPCYNEEQTIGKVVADFKAALPEATIYVYDNNSTDQTCAVAKAAGAVIGYEHVQGKGAVIRRMFRDIDAQCYLMIDGDDTYPAIHAREMVDKILNGEAEMVVGDRLSSTYFTENKRRFHNAGNKSVRGLINFLFKNDVRDIMTGYRAFSYLFVKSFPVLSKGFEIETEMTIHALDKKMSIENVIVDYKDRPEGSESKLNTVSDGMRVMKTIFKLFKNYRPLMFFGIISAILLLASAGIMIPIVIEYFRTHLVLRFPTLIVCGFMAMAALQSYFTGMILNILRSHQKQQFEISLNQFAAEYKNKLYHEEHK